MSRKSSRKHAFMLVYQIEFDKNLDMNERMENYLSTLDNVSEIDREFINREVFGILENLNDIDKIISENLTGWSISRIAKIDLAALRLSIYELLNEKSIPTGVAINEAVEFSKTYGSPDTTGFINSLLRKVAENARSSE